MLSRNPRRSHRGLLVAGIVALVVALLGGTSFFDGAGAVFIGLLVIPAIIGGALALGIRLFTGRPSSSGHFRPDAFGKEGGSGAINMSRIRVAGVSGLGFIVVAIVTAFVLPRVGDTLALGLVGGAIGGGLILLYRRHGGPLRSGGQAPGGRAFLVDPDGDDDDEPTPVLRNLERASSHGRLENRGRQEAHKWISPHTSPTARQPSTSS